MLKSTRNLLVTMIISLFALSSLAVVPRSTPEFEGPCSKLPANLLPAELLKLIPQQFLTEQNRCRFDNISITPSAFPNWLEIIDPKGKRVVFAYINTHSQLQANQSKNCHWENWSEKMESKEQSVEKLGFLCTNQ